MSTSSNSRNSSYYDFVVTEIDNFITEIENAKGPKNKIIKTNELFKFMNENMERANLKVKHMFCVEIKKKLNNYVTKL